MKNVSKILMFIFIGGLISAALFLNSCSKDDVSKINVDSASDGILSLKNEKEYQETLNKVLAMNNKELKAFEESHGYKSFGRKCDEIYFSIKPEDFKSVEEVKAFVAKNSEYLQLVEDASGELTLETKMLRCPERYLINQDFMFKINSDVFSI